MFIQRRVMCPKKAQTPYNKRIGMGMPDLVSAQKKTVHPWPRWATEDDVLCRRPPDYIHGTAYLGVARNANAGFPHHRSMPNLQCPVYAVHILEQCKCVPLP